MQLIDVTEIRCFIVLINTVSILILFEYTSYTQFRFSSDFVKSTISLMGHWTDLKYNYRNFYKWWCQLGQNYCSLEFSVNATTGGIGLLLNLHALKTLNSIERIQLRTCILFNSNSSTIIISCYSPTNANDETDIINKLSSFA